MTIKYNVMNDEQINAMREPLSEGEAFFKVVAAEETTSKSSGKPMIKLTLLVKDRTGKQGNLWDYLTFTDNMIWKFKSFMESINFLSMYQTGEISTDPLVGKSGVLTIKHQENKDRGGIEAKVNSYVKPSDSPFKPNRSTTVQEDQPPMADEYGQQFKDDDIDF